MYSTSRSRHTLCKDLQVNHSHLEKDLARTAIRHDKVWGSLLKTNIQFPFEFWGGVECTVNRVQDTYFDQMKRSGHMSRIRDLDLFASLGVTKLRYPVIWEQIAPIGLESADWTWPDKRLKRLQALNIRPIVGLVHHGSGPLHTNLLDPGFAEGMAEYAGAVAARYPQVMYYTPINEPLTTARFSGLYGHWYPHAADGLSFIRALLSQCKAVVLAMCAIRQINPDAKLVQTDDLGKTHSTPKMAYQAEHENERRWLSYDLICGRVNQSHPLWQYLHWVGITDDELLWFLDNSCPPDIMGFNYYLTSERFLDEDTARYAQNPTILGPNGDAPYVDVAAVRVLTDGLPGPRVLLREAWDRYGLPLALTEVHNGSTRDEQLRWFADVLKDVTALYNDGVDVKAVTAWALLGSYDWNSLVTRDAGYYEPGVFDIRTSPPRPTRLAKAITNWTHDEPVDHPVLAGPGWWKRPERLIYGFSIQDRSTERHPIDWSNVSQSYEKARTLLITGAGGTLGKAFVFLCELRGLPYIPLTRQELNIADSEAVGAVLDKYNPWAVINTAGYVRVDEAEDEADLCYDVNTTGPEVLARNCHERGIRFATFSSDLVFDGRKAAPYVESDTVGPLNIYGQSKAEAERRVIAVMPDALIIRTSAFFSPWDSYNFVTIALRTLAGGERFSAADDMLVSPTYIPDLAQTCLDLIIDGESGLWHLANQGVLTWADLARRVAERAGLGVEKIEARSHQEMPQRARRPVYSALGSERGLLLAEVDEALDRYLGDVGGRGAQQQGFMRGWDTPAVDMRLSLGRRDLLR
jgi:dTDP-4-dehydrorhamnose reductase